MNIIGTNVHGLLENASFLRFITDLEGHIPEYSEILENNLAELSAVVSRNMVLDGILRYLESE